MESMTANYTALTKQTETSVFFLRWKVIVAVRAKSVFEHTILFFVDSNRLHQWPQMRKPKDNQIDHMEVLVASLPSHFGSEAHSMPKAVSLPCFFPVWQQILSPYAKCPVGNIAHARYFAPKLVTKNVPRVFLSSANHG